MGKIFNEKLELNEKDEKKFLNGVSIKINAKDGIYNTYINGIFIGLSKVEKDNIESINASSPDATDYQKRRIHS